LEKFRWLEKLLPTIVEKAKTLSFFNNELVVYFKKSDGYKSELLLQVRIYLKFEWNWIKIGAIGKKFNEEN